MTAELRGEKGIMKKNTTILLLSLTLIMYIFIYKKRGGITVLLVCRDDGLVTAQSKTHYYIVCV